MLHVAPPSGGAATCVTSATWRLTREGVTASEGYKTSPQDSWQGLPPSWEQEGQDGPRNRMNIGGTTHEQYQYGTHPRYVRCLEP